MKVGIILFTVLALSYRASAFAAHIPRHHAAIKSEQLFGILFNITDIPFYGNGTWNNGTWNNTLGPQAACYQQYGQDVYQITVTGGEKLRNCVQLALQDLKQYFDVNDVQSTENDFKQQIDDCKQRPHYKKMCQTKAVVDFANKVRPYLLADNMSIDRCVEHELFKISAQLNMASNKLAFCLLRANQPPRPTWRPTGPPANTTTDNNATWTTPINPTGTTPNFTTWQPTTPFPNATTDTPIWNMTTPWPNNTTAWPNNTTPSWNNSSPWQNNTTPSWNMTTVWPNNTTPSWNNSSPWQNNTTPGWNNSTWSWNTTTPSWNTTWLPTTTNSTNNTTRPWPTFPTFRTTSEAPETTTDESLLQSIWNDIKKLF